MRNPAPASQTEETLFALALFAMFLSGSGLFGLQIYWLLRYGKWTSLSIIDACAFVMNPDRASWVFAPNDWLGAHALLDWISFPALLMVAPLVIFIAAIINR